MRTDCIIVGQGIAGTVLAHQLHNLGQEIVIIDKPHLSTCSSVAAGIWNPVVFKRLSKSWMADEVLPVMLDFYRSCGKKLGLAFTHERRMVKPFSEAQEIAFWQKKALDNAYLDEAIGHHYRLSTADTVEDYSTVKSSGNLHVQAFLQGSRSFFESRASCLEEEFDHSTLQLSEGGVSYKHIDARRIIFCEGHLIRKNPFFKHVPMKPAKGEVLTIYCEGLMLGEDIFNKNFFILPLGDHLYKAGATYEWEHLNDLPTEGAKADLLSKLHALLHVPFEVIHHQAGVRPSVIDRRPILGSMSSYPQVHVFNGFGTKAVMLAPYFSRALCQYMLEGKNLNSEVDVKRFDKNE